MARYAESADVVALISRLDVGSTTDPDTTEVNSILDGVSAEVDAALAGAGYTVPATTPAWWVNDFLRMLTAKGAAPIVLMSMFPGGAADIVTAAEMYAADYKAGLATLRDGSAIPTEAAGVGGLSGTPSTYLTRNPESEENLGAIAEPSFKVGMTF